MPVNNFQGDPYLTLSPNGSRLHYIAGQPVMDRGFENMTNIALLTKDGWIGNTLISDPDKQIGSDFVEKNNQPITLKSLTDVEQSAVRALSFPAFGSVTATTTNPESDRRETVIRVEPPGQDAQELLITRNGLNWQSQAIEPAHERV